MKLTQVKYKRMFGLEGMVYGIKEFPLIIADKDVFMRQADGYNCGLGVVANIMDFYIYQSMEDYGRHKPLSLIHI